MTAGVGQPVHVRQYALEVLFPVNLGTDRHTPLKRNGTILCIAL